MCRGSTACGKSTWPSGNIGSRDACTSGVTRNLTPETRYQTASQSHDTAVEFPASSSQAPHSVLRAHREQGLGYHLVVGWVDGAQVDDGGAFVNTGDDGRVPGPKSGGGV